MANIDYMTLKNLVAPNLYYQSLCISYLKVDASLELKFGLIHLLTRFHGLAREDPYKHLKDFHVVC